MRILTPKSPPPANEQHDSSAHSDVPLPVALVTGGGRGIGRAIAEHLCSDGFSVVACGRSERPQDLPDEVHWVVADVAKTADCERVVQEAAARGHIGALVNNAGVQLTGKVPEVTDQDWDLLMGVNCRGVFAMARAAIPHLAAHRGSIVNIGSMAGNTAEYSMPLYNASKAFVHGLTRAIAVDHGPRIRCNAVSPGWIATELTVDAFALSSNPHSAQHDTEIRHPLRRLGKPQDVAAAVAWLLSDQASFITGQCITVDGGLTSASPILPD